MTTISHHFLVFDKSGFESCMSKLTKRYKVQFDVKWGNIVEDTILLEDGYPLPITRYNVDVEFSFDGYKIDGYTYLGCIKDETEMGFITIHGNDLTEKMNLSEFVSSFDNIPCHNCNRRHKRKIGHVFQVDETGEFIVFGSSCAKNYFGINFSKLMSFFERIELGVDKWDEDSFRVFKSNIVNLDKVCKLSYFFIRNNGFLSASKAQETDHMSTSDLVKVCQINMTHISKEDKEYMKNLDVDFSLLYTKQFVKDMDNLSSFDHNIITIQKKMENGICSNSDIGIICYLIYKTFFCEENGKVEYELPEWDKGYKLVDVNVEFIGSSTFEGYYGTTNIYHFITEDNVRLTWFTQSNLTWKFDSFEVGNMFTIRCTVKEVKKDERYGNSVIITRATLKEVK